MHIKNKGFTFASQSNIHNQIIITMTNSNSQNGKLVSPFSYFKTVGNFTSGKSLANSDTYKVGYWHSSATLRETAKYYYLTLPCSESKNGNTYLCDMVFRAEKKDFKDIQKWIEATNATNVAFANEWSAYNVEGETFQAFIKSEIDYRH